MRSMDWKRGLAVAVAALGLCASASAQQYTVMSQEPAGVPVVYGRNATMAGSKFSAGYHAAYYQSCADRWSYMRWAEMRQAQLQMAMAERQAYLMQMDAQVAAKKAGKPVRSTPMSVSSNVAATLPKPIMVETPEEMKGMMVSKGTESVLSSTVIAERVYRINPDGTQTLISQDGQPEAAPERTASTSDEIIK